MTMKLKGKVAIITGASSGIGAETSVEFATEGCSLALVGRNVVNLKAVQDKCLSRGLNPDQVLLIVADVVKEDELKNVVDSTLAHFQKLDILVNSAGILTSGSIETLSIEKYDEIMNVNVRSIFILMQLAVPHLLKTKGSILNVSSITGLRAFPNVLGYCMSKAAIDQLTRCVALELGPQGVRVNAVNPGVIVTEIHKRSGMTDEQYEEFLEKSKITHALGRPGTVDEVAKTIVFLVSDGASFITGQTLCVDGGRSVMCPR